MNVVAITGNLTRDPELKYTTGVNPLAVCAFSVAISRGKDGADFPRVKCFGKVAENVDRYLSKGSKVAVVGHIQTGSYDKDGRKVFTTDIIADRVEFLGGKTDTGDFRSQFEDAESEAPF